MLSSDHLVAGTGGRRQRFSVNDRDRFASERDTSGGLKRALRDGDGGPLDPEHDAEVLVGQAEGVARGHGFATTSHDEALVLADELAPRLEASGDVYDLAAMRSAQVWIWALRGQGVQIREVLEWLESSSRELGDPLSVVQGLGSAAVARAGLGQGKAAAALLTEIEAYSGARDTSHYPAFLPAMVRTVLAIANRELAKRLVGGLEPSDPYAEHALVAANAERHRLPFARWSWLSPTGRRCYKRERRRVLASPSIPICFNGSSRRRTPG